MRRRKNHQIKAFSIFATLLMLISLMTPTAMTAQSLGVIGSNDKVSEASVENKVSNRLEEAFKKEDKVTFLIKFNEKADTKKAAEEGKAKAANANLSRYQTELMQRSSVVSALKTTALASQQDVKAFLEQEEASGNVENVHSYYIVNGIAVTATKDVALKIASFKEVEKILPNEKRELIGTVNKEPKAAEPHPANDIEWNVDRVRAPEVWDMGFDGSGTVVASIDTGVQWDHPALKHKYRGYDEATGEVEHDFNWFDAVAGESEAFDDLGHGTHVTGTMVGGEPDGTNQVGVAPGAKWIAVKAFTEDGGRDTDLLDAAQWIMAPTDSDGNERIDMAPDVVNNSWGGGPGLDEWYRDVVISWRNANIFPEFSAGNTTLFNPGGPGSIANPANYPESFATGATDSDDELADFSLRGPSPYGEIKPDISAPGVNIRSAIPGGGYAANNGTSMSGPAVSAVAAILRQVDANMSVDDMEDILMNTAVPLTNQEYPESPNHGFGYGLVNAFDAVSFIADGLGAIEGSVSKQGADHDAPTFSHKATKEVYVDMDADLKINADDNISILSVELVYQVNDGAWKTMDASLITGDYTDGEYKVTIPGEELPEEGSLTYRWVINDYGNNEVISDDYEAVIDTGVSIGYFEDFEEEPAGWTSFGIGDDWEWGIPTSGPEEAASGEHVYATNLHGSYTKDANATLVMPAVNLPEGDAYLLFDLWYDLEEIHDVGYVYVSTDQKEWNMERIVFYASDGWRAMEVDLSDYSGQRIYIGFNIDSNTPNNITKPGMYLDNVELSSTPRPSSQGTMTAHEHDLLSNHMDMEQVKQSKPAMDRSVEDQIAPAALPLNAEVSILGTSRSTGTNPADGTYALSSLASGEYTLQADAYGYESEQQTVTVERNKTTAADFVLEEIPQGTVSGTVTDETGNIIQGANLFLVEDANIAPVTSDENGHYNLTAYEGTYTLKAVARGYHYEEIEITIEDGQMEVNLGLTPYYSYKHEEIAYDDGTGDIPRTFYDRGNRAAVKMSLAEGEDSAIITDGVFQFHDDHHPRPGPGSTEFAVEVWDASGEDGLPGERLAGPIEAEAIRDINEWTVVDLRDENIIVDGDFYMVYVQTNVDRYSPALASDVLGTYAGRSFEHINGYWDQSHEFEGNYMIRARVGYEADIPEITSPAEGVITTEPDVTIEGTANPETTIQLMKNGEEVGSAEIGDDGIFTFPTVLTEGENEFKAVTLLEGDVSVASDPVTVTLDTQAPELTIDNPKDGDKTKRETVTVEGTVADANLDYVKVNGQKANVSDGTYSKRILLDNGENIIEVEAMDEAGNSITKSVTIQVKYNAPEIENLTPTEDHYLETGESVKIEFESEPGLRTTFVIHMPLTNLNGLMRTNATELPMMEMQDGHYVGYWTATKNAYAEGAVIEVIVKDSFGNVVREQAAGKLFINTENEQ